MLTLIIIVVLAVAGVFVYLHYRSNTKVVALETKVESIVTALEADGKKIITTAKSKF